MLPISLIASIPCANTLGEGVQWNPLDGCVWWTDIHQAKLFRFHLTSERLTEWQLPERLCCFAFAKQDERIIAAFESGFAWFDSESGALEWVAKPELHLSGNRSNDGRCDRQGRFWMGSMVEDPRAGQSAALYSLDPQMQVTKHLDELRISNALCWSPDSRYLYHADSPSFTICVYDFAADTGRLSNGRVFAATEAGVEPDGACVDAQGFVWNAQWGGHRVRRYSPAGELDLELPVPVSQPTCVAFGGDKLDLLLVTSARVGLTDAQLAEQPQAGNLFIYQTPYQGLEESRFG